MEKLYLAKTKSLRVTIKYFLEKQNKGSVLIIIKSLGLT